MRIVMPLMPTDDGRSGIFRYLSRVAPALIESRSGGDDIRFLVLQDDRDRFEELPDSLVDLIDNRYGRPLGSILWHAAALPQRLLGTRDTVLLLPAGNRRLSPLAPVGSLVVVHDLNQIDMSDKYDGWRMFYVRQLVRRGLLRAHHIAAVSQHTADQLQRIGIPAERITVVPNGVDAGRFRRVDADARRRALQHVGLEPGYLLYVSRIEHPGKNHMRLLEAVARLRRDGLQVPPVLLVGSDWTGAEAVHRRAEEPDLRDAIRFGGFVPDEHLPALYAQARALVFPSLAEGFGLPLLEAMAASCPVVCSNRSPMSDIAGDAAFTFDPEDPDSIAAQLRILITRRALRADLVRRGRRRVAQYSWRSHADTLWHLSREKALATARMELHASTTNKHGVGHVA